MNPLGALLFGAAVVVPCLRPGQMAQPITGAPYCVNAKHGVCKTCRPDAPQIQPTTACAPCPAPHRRQRRHP
jgi:hypothetical protein